MYIPAHVCVSIFRQANTYTKLFKELGIVIGTQILNMLQECLLVDRPDRTEEEHLEGEKCSKQCDNMLFSLGLF